MMGLNICRIVVIGLLIFVLQGCATFSATPSIRHQSDENEEAALFFTYLDEAVEKEGVRDASSFPVKGFPYLRTNRFLGALSLNLQEEHQKTAWVYMLQKLALESRTKEIRNLPPKAVCRLNLMQPSVALPSKEALLARTVFYSEQLLQQDQKRPGFYDAVRQSMTIAGEYSTWMRVMGYPLAAPVVSLMTCRAQRKFSEWHRKPEDALSLRGELVTYQFVETNPYDKKMLTRIFSTAERDTFGLLLLSAKERNTILRAFAPVIYQDAVGDYDRFGKVFWDGEKPAVDPNRPTVYYYFTHAFLKGQPFLQVNYVIWYSARRGPAAPWIERGRLDGLTLRLSLDPAGRPFMLDVMNNCGCYHFFVPRREAIKQIIEKPLALDPFVPQWLPESFPARRLRLRVNSGWHQVNHIGVEEKTGTTVMQYTLLPYDILENLPYMKSDRRSIFDSAGIVKDSKRIEPLVFFPMGIRRVGSMRQRGHHAIKLVGRAYFDDPFLFEKNFVFK